MLSPGKHLPEKTNSVQNAEQAFFLHNTKKGSRAGIAITRNLTKSNTYRSSSGSVGL